MPTSAFGHAVHMAIKRADRLATADLGSTIVLALTNLEAVGAVFRTPNYQTVYNEHPAEVFQDLSMRADGIYQQLHALCEQITQLIRQATEPPLAASSLGGLAAEADKKGHPLSAALRSRRRELNLLTWLCAVRNKAVQHRAENGYHDNNAIVLTDGFVLLRNPVPPKSSIARKAQAALRGLVIDFGLDLDIEHAGAQETVAYLDLVAHGLVRQHPARADPARRVIEEAGLHYVCASAAILDNMAWALGRLLEIAPEHPNAIE